MDLQDQPLSAPKCQPQSAPRFSLVGPVWPYRGGIAHHTALVAAALRRQDYPTQVISFKRQYPRWLYPGATDQDTSTAPLKAEAEYLLDPFNPLSWEAAAASIAAFQADLVAIQWWTTFWGLPLGRLGRSIRRSGRKLVVFIHNVLPHEPRPGDAWLARQALSPAHAFIVHSEQERGRLLRLLPGRRVIVTPLPVFRLPETPLHSPAEARRRLELPEDAPVALFFGFVRPYKGLALLLEALGALHSQGLRPHLLIAGEFWHGKDAYLTQIERLGLGAYVHIHDRYIPNEEVPDFFCAADVLAAPYVEGTTQSAVASLAASFGIPMVISQQVAQGIGPEGRSGLTVTPTGDAAALAQALHAILSAGEAARLPRQAAADDCDRTVQHLLTLVQDAAA